MLWLFPALVTFMKKSQLFCWQNNLRERSFVLAHGFGSFPPMIISGPMVTQNIMMVYACDRRCLLLGEQETGTMSQESSLVTYFLQLGPTSYCFQNVLKITLPAGDQIGFEHMSCWGISLSNHNISITAGSSGIL